MLDIAVPENMQESGTYIIPGHGSRVCDEADLVEYRDMLYEIGDRMRDLVNVQHLKLADVKLKRPVLGWEGRYGRPEWNRTCLSKRCLRSSGKNDARSAKLRQGWRFCSRFQRQTPRLLRRALHRSNAWRRST